MFVYVDLKKTTVYKWGSFLQMWLSQKFEKNDIWTLYLKVGGISR
jgi:hypothetical protein